MDKNDIQRLKNEADIESVIYYLGIPVTKRGSANFILCPNPGHNDHKATNCYFKQGWNNVYCRACNKSTNAVDLIMHTMNCNYGEAADILWEIEGCPEWYYAKSGKKEKPVFMLTRDEAEFLGFHQYPNIECIMNASSCKTDIPKSQRYSRQYIDEYVICEAKLLSYKDFLTQDMYESMVRKIIKERQNRNRILKRKYGLKSNILYASLWQAVDEDEKKCDEILKRLKESHVS